jgi:DNA invertase Pin-like site-specific DNA recombinase
MDRNVSDGGRARLIGLALPPLSRRHLDLTTPIGRGFLAFLSALAQDERERIVKRANDGRGSPAGAA